MPSSSKTQSLPERGTLAWINAIRKQAAEFGLRDVACEWEDVALMVRLVKERDAAGKELAGHLSAQAVCSCASYPFRLEESGHVTDNGAVHEPNCLLQRVRGLGWNPVVG